MSNRAMATSAPESADASHLAALARMPKLIIEGGKYQRFIAWDGFHDLTSQYDWDTVEEITGVPDDKCEEAVKTWTTRVNPRHGNKVPSHDEAIVIAKRMGGAMRTSQSWPNPKTVFTRNAGEVDADRFPIYREPTDSSVAKP